MSNVIAPDWPIYFKNILRVGSLDSNVAVVTLWTERDIVEKALKPGSFAAVGNLYAAAGINHMMRNIFANPRIRYLIIWGADMSQSGHALMKLMEKGIDDDYKIIDARGEIEKEIPRKAVEEFRKVVKVIDMRGKTLEAVNKTIAELPKLPPFSKEYRIFPPAKPRVSEWPSESTGFRAEGDTVAQTWLKIINLISKYGKTEKTRYASNNKLKEILNLTAVVQKEDPEHEYLPHYMPFSMQELQSYYPEMMTKRRIPGAAYNYGDRMRNQVVVKEDSKTLITINQIKEIINLLKRRPFSKKAYAVLYRADDWLKADSSDTPCMTQLHARITQNKLFLTAYFRSQDMFHGWPRNAFALRKVQKEMADGVGIAMGPLTIVTMSAHMYADDWKTAEDILSQSYLPELKYQPRYPHLKLDPRGNWLIDVEYDTEFSPDKFYTAPSHTHAIKKESAKGKIIARLFPDERMSTPLGVFEGRTAKEVFWQIIDWEIVNFPSHAFSLGEELAKAEIAIRLGLEFKMDAPLDLSRISKNKVRKTVKKAGKNHNLKKLKPQHTR
jgi:thymidylate synthase